MPWTNRRKRTTPGLSNVLVLFFFLVFVVGLPYFMRMMLPFARLKSFNYTHRVLGFAMFGCFCYGGIIELDIEWDIFNGEMADGFWAQNLVLLISLSQLIRSHCQVSIQLNPEFVSLLHFMFVIWTNMHLCIHKSVHKPREPTFRDGRLNRNICASTKSYG